jgi:hypothetical protein
LAGDNYWKVTHLWAISSKHSQTWGSSVQVLREDLLVGTTVFTTVHSLNNLVPPSPCLWTASPRFWLFSLPEETFCLPLYLF